MVECQVVDLVGGMEEDLSMQLSFKTRELGGGDATPRNERLPRSGKIKINADTTEHDKEIFNKTAYRWKSRANGMLHRTCEGCEECVEGMEDREVLTCDEVLYVDNEHILKTREMLQQRASLERNYPTVEFDERATWVNEFINLVETDTRHYETMTIEQLEAGVADSADITPLKIQDREGQYHDLVNTDDTLYGINNVGYPTTLRPIDFQRDLNEEILDDDIDEWWSSVKITIGPAADDESKIKLAKRILYTWRDIFNDDLSKLPACRLAKHWIPTLPGTVPHKASNPLFTAEETEWMSINIPKLVDSKILTFSNSQWSNKPKFVRKKDGTLRMVNVFCKLNKETIKQNTPMRRIEPILHSLMQPKYKCYWQTDATMGYWGILLAEEHAYKTAFNTPFGQFCYLRMGMGLQGAAHTYARMKDIFAGPIPSPRPEPGIAGAGVSNDSAYEFFQDDDYGAHTDFMSQAIFLHTKYFPRIAWSGLNLNPAKTYLWMDHLNLLGYSGSGRGGLRPSIDKLAAIRDYPIPQTAEDVERFLHITTYLRQWIPGRSEHSKILKTSLSFAWNARGARRDMVLNWKPEHQLSFDHIKNSLLENMIWGGDPSIQYHLATDASNLGHGGVLFQLINTPPGTIAAPKYRSLERVVMFLSKPFALAETRYHTTEREALAVVRSLNEVRWLVIGSRYPIKIYTDHQALVSILKGDDARGRIVRWQLSLAEFDMEIHHVPGCQNVLADGMSRMRTRHEEPASESEDIGIEVMGIDKEGGWSLWKDDEWYGVLVEYKLTGSVPTSKIEQRMGSIKLTEPEIKKWTRRMKQQSTRFVLVDNETQPGKDVPNSLFYKERDGTLALCIRKNEVKPILYWAHDTHGHFAEAITLRKIMGNYYWPTRHRDTSYYCRSCDSCQRVGPLRPSQDVLPVLHLQPFDMIGIDFMGPITPMSEGNKYIIIVVDYFTRYLFTKAVSRNTSAEVVAFLNEIGRFVGWPRAVYCDNGSHFVSAEVQQLLRSKGVKQYPAPKSHPSSVGLAERYVQLVTLGFRTIFTTYPQHMTIWSTFLPQITHSINTRIIRTHGYTPSQLLYGFNIRNNQLDATPRDRIVSAVVLEHHVKIAQTEEIPMVLAIRDPVGSIDSTISAEIWTFHQRMERVEEIREITRERLVLKGIIKRPGRFWEAPKEGDLVLLRRFQTDKQHDHKFDPRWEGPYILTDVSWHGRTGRVKDLHTGQIARVRKSGLRERIHLDDLKVFIPREDRWLGFDADLKQNGQLRFVGMCEMLGKLRLERGL